QHQRIRSTSSNRPPPTRRAELTCTSRPAYRATSSRVPSSRRDLEALPVPSDATQSPARSLLVQQRLPGEDGPPPEPRACLQAGAEVPTGPHLNTEIQNPGA